MPSDQTETLILGSVEFGCAYIMDDGTWCGQAKAGVSSYCDRHHALCHLRIGSPGERSKLKFIDAIARRMGGKWVTKLPGLSRLR